LASGSEDKTVRLWDLVNGRQFPVHQGHQQEVWALALSPDGSAVISGGGDGAILLWDPHTGEQRAVLARQRGSVESLVCSSDGMTLASGGEDGIIFWDLASGQQRTVIQGHHDKVWALAFNPTGTTLISGGDDGVVMLWEVWNLPRLLHVPLGHMNQTDYHHMQSLAADTTLSPTHQAVARYITAALGYRLSMGKRDACAV
jgi:WD40 repeat protein